MKKLSKIFVAMFVIGCVLSSMFITTHAAFGREYYAPKGTPTVDGTMEGIWDTAEWTNVDKPYDGTDISLYSESLRIKLLWDENGLYVFAEVVDLDINYANDLVEVYIDEDGAHRSIFDRNDSHTRIRSDGTLDPLGTNTKASSNNATAVGIPTENGYKVEAFLPWTGTVDIKVNTVMGLEFMLNIGDSTQEFTQAFRWNADTSPEVGDNQPSKSTKHWGVLVLADENGAFDTTEEPDVPDNTTENGNPDADAPDTDAPEAPEKDDSKIDPIVFVAIGAAVVVVAIVVAIVVKKTKK